MYAVLRAVPVALGSLLAMIEIRAQSDARPPIFAHESASSGNLPAPRPITRAPSLLSDRMREVLTNYVLENAPVLNDPVARANARRGSRLAFGDTVMMDELVVKSSPLRFPERPPADPPLLNYLKTGSLYHHLDHEWKRTFRSAS